MGSDVCPGNQHTSKHTSMSHTRATTDTQLSFTQLLLKEHGHMNTACVLPGCPPPVAPQSLHRAQCHIGA